MTKKTYDIHLDNNKKESTELENADAPMGLVCVQMNFIKLTSG